TLVSARTGESIDVMERVYYTVQRTSVSPEVLRGERVLDAILFGVKLEVVLIARGHIMARWERRTTTSPRSLSLSCNATHWLRTEWIVAPLPPVESVAPCLWRHAPPLLEKKCNALRPTLIADGACTFRPNGSCFWATLPPSNGPVDAVEFKCTQL